VVTIKEPAKWVATGGVGGSGYISITDAINDQNNGTIVLPEIDPAGTLVGGFILNCKIQIGGGTARPADGMAISFGPDIDEGSAGGEEGAGTGIIISFDTWDNNNTDTAPAIDVKVGGNGDDLIVATAFAVGEREGGRARPGPIFHDPTSGRDLDLQTGTNWADVSIQLQEGLLNLTYNGIRVFQGVPILFAPTAGRFMFSGRTGGANENNWIDDLSITTLPPSTTPTITKFTPGPLGVFIQLSSTGTSVDTNTIRFSFDTNSVTPVVSSTATNTTITYTLPATNALAIGSSHTATLIFSDTGTPAATKTNILPFTVAPYATIPSSYAVASNLVNLTASGFLIRPYQTEQANPNTLEWTEEQLAGLHGPNIADLTGATNNGSYVRSTVINFDVGAGAGNFQPDEPFPGLPGTTASTANATEEIITYLDLPAAGAYTMGVNSDDGFKVTTAPNPRDPFGLVLGSFNAGRGSADTIFTFVVPQAGIYPFRLLWENGGSGANLEWFSVTNGTRILINDQATPGHINAYWSAPAGPPYATSFIGSLGGFNIGLLNSGTNVVNTASIQTLLNSSNVTSTITTNGEATTIVYTPTSPISAGTNLLNLTFTYGTSTSTIPFTFVVAPFVTIPSNYVAAPGAVDRTQPGFFMRPHQTTNAQPNDLQWTEQQLVGLQGPNIADLTGADTNGFVRRDTVINFDVGAGAGNFQPDEPFPGLPGINGDTLNAAEEILAYLDLPTAGAYTMGVNSDDGFRVTVEQGVLMSTVSSNSVGGGATNTVGSPGLPLGEFNGGRGATDTIFSFFVPQAGAYPFRLIWENGGSGANLEWFTVVSNSVKVLVNDTATPGSIKAFRGQLALGATGGGGGTNQPPPGTNEVRFTSVQRDTTGSNLTIQWTGAGTLQSAPEATGPWTDVPGSPPSPATVPISGNRQFYRLRP